MKAKDKIALLVSGKLTVKQIQELEEQEAREASEESSKDPESEKVPDEVDYKKLYEELKAEQDAKHEDQEKQEDVPDFKALYEAEAAKVTKLQKANANQNLRDGEEKELSPEEIMIKAYSVPK